MRPLTEAETTLVFEKLAKYVGANVKLLIDRPDEPYCFRLQKDRVYYVSERVMLKATNVARDNLVSLGVCMGKFTKTGKFRLAITALDLVAQYVLYKIWIKPNGEMPFLYGNHVLKAHIGRMSEDIEQYVRGGEQNHHCLAGDWYAGVVVFNMADIPLGFGVAAKSTADCRKLDPTAIVAFHQADVGEYLRSEDTLT